MQPSPAFRATGAVYGTPMDDPIYRRLFAFPRMVEDLLRAVAAGDWIDAVDVPARAQALAAARTQRARGTVEAICHSAG